MSDDSTLSAFRAVPRTGVIYVTTEAAKRGFHGGDPAWSNLGQGQPETGPLPGAPPRVHDVTIDVDDQEYAPIPGIWELREAIASLYNHLYRRGMPSRYSAENVAVSGGGRAALTRAAASLGHVNLGHFLPDYTAYEELLDIFKAFTAIPILLEGERGYAFTVDDLRREVHGRGLAALLLSNPCNPTGKLVQGDELASWVSVARELDCAMLFDEFYSHYIWTAPAGGRPGRARPPPPAPRRAKPADLAITGPCFRYCPLPELPRARSAAAERSTAWARGAGRGARADHRTDDKTDDKEAPIRALLANLVELREIAEREERYVEALVRRVAPAPVYRVPMLATDVHDLAGLSLVAAHLFEDEGD